MRQLTKDVSRRDATSALAVDAPGTKNSLEDPRVHPSAPVCDPHPDVFPICSGASTQFLDVINGNTAPEAPRCAAMESARGLPSHTYDGGDVLQLAPHDCLSLVYQSLMSLELEAIGINNSGRSGPIGPIMMPETAVISQLVQSSVGACRLHRIEAFEDFGTNP
jgi:hypothetical protein